MRKEDRLNKRHDEMFANNYELIKRDQWIYCYDTKLSKVHYSTQDLKHMVVPVIDIPKPFRMKYSK